MLCLSPTFSTRHLKRKCLLVADRRLWPCPHRVRCNRYVYLNTFGSFDDKNAILYKVTYDVSMHLLALIPTILCGLIGGFLGTVFTVMNLKVSRWRKRVVAPNK